MAATTTDTVAPGTRKSSKDKILSRVGDLRKKDPKLYDAFTLIAKDLDAVTLQLNPVIEAAAAFKATQELPPPVTVFAYTLSTTAVNLTWSAPSPIGSTVFYEIRTGTAWDAGGFVLRTPSLGAALNPLTVGNHDYMIKTVNGLGDYSVDFDTLVVTIPALGTPVVSAQVIDNNVLLTWTEPSSSFTVDYYEVLKDSVVQGELSGLFMALFETSSGTYVYGIIAYDIAGNASAEGQVSADVDEPPDFELLASQAVPLTTGTHTNTYYEATNGKTYGPVELAETYEDHFTTAPGGSGGPWASPQEQVDDGQDRFIQENVATGNWVSAEIDLGSTLTNVIANLAVVLETLTGTTDPTWTIAMKGGTVPGGGAFVNGYSQFFAAVRYISVRITVAAVGADLDSFGRFSNVQLGLNVKYTIDGNVIACVAADAAGTQVDIPGVAANGHGTKTFADVDSITLAPIETNNQAVTAIYDFVDAPNPTDFKILCYDSAGRRCDATVSWKVRGIKA